jgi:peroxiredoxin
MLKFVLSFMMLFNLASAFALDGAPSDSLGEGLSQRKKTFSEKMPKDVVALFEKNIQEQKASGIEKQSLKVGDKVPDVMVDLDGKKVQLSRIYAKGPVVLKFYRGGWCPYCMMELKHYEKMNAEFKKAGAQILAIAPDNASQIRNTKTKNSLSYDVVSDDNHEIAKKFKLVYKVDAKVVEHLKKNGVDLSVYHGDNENELSIPGTFVIGKDGVVAFAYVDADYRQRAEPSTVLQAVKALK